MEQITKVGNEKCWKSYWCLRLDCTPNMAASTLCSTASHFTLTASRIDYCAIALTDRENEIVQSANAQLTMNPNSIWLLLSNAPFVAR